MHKKLQQLKTFITEDPLFFFCILFIVLLPIYSGQIIANSHAFILGKYINYLHVRVSLHLILSFIISLLYFKKNENRSTLLFFLSTFTLGVALSINPISALTKGLSVKFFPLFLSSVFHFFEFLLSTVAVIIATGVFINKTGELKKLGLQLVLASIVTQLLFGIAQFILKGPLFPAFLTWTGQPSEFTSKSIIGIFEYARIYGTTPHPNILAGILAFFVFLVLSVSENSKIKTAALALAYILVIGTLSKSGFIAINLIILIYFLRNFLSKKSISVSTATIITFTFLIALVVAFYFISLSGISATFVESRTVIEQLYLEMLKMSPMYLLTGTGFTMAIPTLLSKAFMLPTSIIWGNQILAEPPHNVLLLGVVDLGIPVVLLYTLTTMKLVRNMFARLETWQLMSLVTLLVVLGGLDHYLIY